MHAFANELSALFDKETTELRRASEEEQHNLAKIVFVNVLSNFLSSSKVKLCVFLVEKNNWRMVGTMNLTWAR